MATITAAMKTRMSRSADEQKDYDFVPASRELRSNGRMIVVAAMLARPTAHHSNPEANRTILADRTTETLDAPPTSQVDLETTTMEVTMRLVAEDLDSSGQMHPSAIGLS